MLAMSVLCKIIVTSLKVWVDYAYPQDDPVVKDFRERLGHAYIFCNSLMVLAVGLNLNIWITYYIKIGKQAENPLERLDTALFDKYF